MELQWSSALSPQRVTAHCTLHTATLIYKLSHTQIFMLLISTHVRTDISVKSLTIALFSSLHVEGFNAPASRCKAALHPRPGQAGRAGDRTGFVGIRDSFARCRSPAHGTAAAGGQGPHCERGEGSRSVSRTFALPTYPHLL